MFEYRDTPQGKVLSAGYPAVEALVDSEQFDPLNAAFEKAYEELSAIARQKRGLRRSREARKAMRAIERVMDLLRELLAIKYRMQQATAKPK
ncbi:MAG: hypothetical protein HYV03_06815 [Deltaproteobacteria bacterium]|nr:hypothetical protein [Deltaproteobacteria bacterium]